MRNRSFKATTRFASIATSGWPVSRRRLLVARGTIDQRVHQILLDTLARHGRIQEGEEHLAATAREFEAEGLDPAPIRDVWRSARTLADGSVQSRTVTSVLAAASAPGPVKALSLDLAVRRSP
jgi:hypothetical protein